MQESATRQAEEFANRLRNRARHFRRWPTKRGITCFRLYERDVPDVPLVVDRYEDALHIAEFARPHDRSPAQHADWLDLMARTASKVLEVPRERVFLKFRDRQRGDDQYKRVDDRGARFVVNEGGLKFVVNLSDYVDTGLFLDHRNTRQMVRERSAGKQVLNLFSYTGSFTVYAAAGGALTTTTVDKSSTYTDWTRENLELNGFAGPCTSIVRSDIKTFLDGLRPGEKWDLAVVDPPTFSNYERLGSRLGRAAGSCGVASTFGGPHRSRRQRVFQHEFPAIQVGRGCARRLFGSRDHAANDSRGFSQRANSQVLGADAAGVAAYSIRWMTMTQSSD